MMKGIYLHIPFCEQKCYYCDFLSYPKSEVSIQEQYIEALIREIKYRVTGAWKKADTIFIGGGTPTVLSSNLLDKLLDVLRNAVDVETVKEFTVEANPGTVDREKLQILKDGGVNRISFGAQSFDEVNLKRLGRIHSEKDIYQAVALAKDIGFSNINLDLMYGLPGECFSTWKQDIDKALQLDLMHLSLYQLIVEEGTPLMAMLNQGHLPTVDDAMAAKAFDWQRQYLAERGYFQYEISNYAKPGYASLHNQLYWRLNNYLGLGLGATGWQRPVRYQNTSDLNRYLTANFCEADAYRESEILETDSQMSETVFMALRMNVGLLYEDFYDLYGTSVEAVFGEAIAIGIKRKWLEKRDEALVLTDLGRKFGNDVFELFI